MNVINKITFQVCYKNYSTIFIYFLIFMNNTLLVKIIYMYIYVLYNIPNFIKYKKNFSYMHRKKKHKLYVFDFFIFILM